MRLIAASFPRGARCLLTVITLLTVLLILPGGLVGAQAPTETPTPTDTPTSTATPTNTATNTPTPTNTPNLYAVSTLPSGQAGAIVYTVSIGEGAIFGELAFVIVLLLVGLFLQLRKQ